MVLVRPEIASEVWTSRRLATMTGDAKWQMSISPPICAILYAEGRVKKNDPAELKGQNSSEICPPDATLRSDFNLTLDQATALHS